MIIQCVYFEAGIELLIHYSDERIGTQGHIAHYIAITITYKIKLKFHDLLQS
jgi:hypothetical protein